MEVPELQEWKVRTSKPPPFPSSLENKAIAVALCLSAWHCSTASYRALPCPHTTSGSPVKPFLTCQVQSIISWSQLLNTMQKEKNKKKQPIHNFVYLIFILTFLFSLGISVITLGKAVERLRALLSRPSPGHGGHQEPLLCVSPSPFLSKTNRYTEL